MQEEKGTTEREMAGWHHHIPKEAKDLYIDSYKTLIKEIKGDTNRWRNLPCSWMRRINTVK